MNSYCVVTGIVTKTGIRTFTIESSDNSSVKFDIMVGIKHADIVHMLREGDEVTVQGSYSMVCSGTIILDEIRSYRRKANDTEKAKLAINAGINELVKDFNDPTRCYIKLSDDKLIPVRANPDTPIKNDHDEFVKTTDIFATLQAIDNGEFMITGRPVIYKGQAALEIHELCAYDSNSDLWLEEYTLGEVTPQLRAHFEIFDDKTKTWCHDSEPDMRGNSEFFQDVLKLNAPESELVDKLPDDISTVTKFRFDVDWYEMPGKVSHMGCLDNDKVKLLRDKYADKMPMLWTLLCMDRFEKVRLVFWSLNCRPGELK